jgi:hypothetical protein
MQYKSTESNYDYININMSQSRLHSNDNYQRQNVTFYNHIRVNPPRKHSDSKYVLNKQLYWNIWVKKNEQTKSRNR